MRQQSPDLQSVTMMSSGTTQNSMSRIFMSSLSLMAFLPCLRPFCRFLENNRIHHQPNESTSHDYLCWRGNDFPGSWLSPRVGYCLTKTLNLKSKQQQGFRTIEKVWNQPSTLRERTVECQYVCMMVVSNSRGLSQIVGCCLTKFQKLKNHALKFPKHLKVCKTVQ